MSNLNSIISRAVKISPLFLLLLLLFVPAFSGHYFMFAFLLALYFLIGAFLAYNLFTHHSQYDLYGQEKDASIQQELWKALGQVFDPRSMIATILISIFAFLISKELGMSLPALYLIMLAGLAAWIIVYLKKYIGLLQNEHSIHEAYLDKRSFILVLRPFRSSIYTDEFLLTLKEGKQEGTQSYLFRDNLFNSILNKINRYAAVFIGGRTGISRNCYDIQAIDEDWKSLLHNLIKEAKAVLFLPGTSESLSYEWEMVVKSYLSKTLVVMPSSLSGDIKKKLALGKTYEVSDALTRENDWERFRQLSYQHFNLLLPKYYHEGGFFIVQDSKFKRVRYSTLELEYFLDNDFSDNISLAETLAKYYGKLPEEPASPFPGQAVK